MNYLYCILNTLYTWHYYRFIATIRWMYAPVSNNYARHTRYHQVGWVAITKLYGIKYMYVHN